MSKENVEVVPDIEVYIKIMEEIKQRVDVVLRLHKGELFVAYRATQVESMILQVRKILELIVLASLSANKSIFEQNRKKFEDHWRPKDIIKDIESINPGFYPIPVEEKPSEDEGVVDLVDAKTKFMDRVQLLFVYSECNRCLHASNLYGEGIDYEYYIKKVSIWIDWIVGLLKTHKIVLLNDDNIYLVRMDVKGEVRI
ncbi:MAG: hypothetical protein OXH16_12110 [Gemmatimonadetes bacterium]|nr:hypothetical protein [Gemmatimonadota bacterium]